MNQDTLVDAVKTALHTLLDSASGDAATNRITDELTQLDLGDLLDRCGSILVEVFADMHAHGSCNVEHSPEEQMFATAHFIRESMFVLAVSTGYKLGHTAATEMFDQASTELDDMFRTPGGDHE